MKRVLTFDVFGDPVPQGSKRAFVVKGKPVLTESAGAKLRTWRSDIVDQARTILGGELPITGPVGVLLRFHLRRPKRPRSELPITRPDVDKLARSVLDALVSAGVMGDDSQVVMLTAEKVYVRDGATPRVYVAVQEVTA